MCFVVSIRLRVPCCLWFEWVIARVVCTNMGLTSFWILRSIGSKSFFVVSLFLLCLFGESSHLTIACCVHRMCACFFRVFYIDWLMGRSIVGLVDCLLDCSIEWLFGCVTGCLVDLFALIDWFLDRLLACSFDWLIDWSIDKWIDWSIDWLT